MEHEILLRSFKFVRLTRSYFLCRSSLEKLISIGNFIEIYLFKLYLTVFFQRVRFEFKTIIKIITFDLLNIF